MKLEQNFSLEFIWISLISWMLRFFRDFEICTKNWERICAAFELFFLFLGLPLNDSTRFMIFSYPNLIIKHLHTQTFFLGSSLVCCSINHGTMRKIFALLQRWKNFQFFSQNLFKMKSCKENIHFFASANGKSWTSFFNLLPLAPR